MMRRIQIIVVLFVFFVLSALRAQALNQQQTVPLPDDDPSRATTAPEKKPLVNPAPAAKPQDGSGAVSSDDTWRGTTTISGVKVDFRVVHSLKDMTIKAGPMNLSLNELSGAEMVEGEPAVIQFRFTDATGTPLSGLSVAAWLDQYRTGAPADKTTCHNKIQAFLQMMLSARPDVDLNTYYVLAMTKEPSILVVDPRVGFSSSKLYTMINLPAPGADWLQTAAGDRVFISLPEAHKVSAIDTLTFHSIARLDVGENPMRLALQAGGKYLWIGNDARQNPAESGVTVLDVTDLRIAARIPTGKGHHEIAFDDGHNVYVTNADDATVSVISIEKLAKVKDVAVGQEPVAIAYSSQGKAIYVAARDGKINAISSEDQKIIATMDAKPGVTTLKVSPDGRWIFVANGKKDAVLQFDVSSNKLQQVYETGPSPDQLAFTAAYLYVRSRESEEVKLIPLSVSGKHGNAAEFPAGQSAPGKLSESLAAAVVPGLDNASAFVVNPADRRIYFYQEGMAAPMTSIEGYGKTPISALVVDHSIHETALGIYSIALRLPKAGNYDVPLFVDSPSLSHCFDFAIKTNPLLKKEVDLPVAMEPLKNNLQVRAGETAQVAFRLTDPVTHKPKDGLQDVGITVLLAEGLRQLRFVAEPVGDGVYQFSFTPPKEGVYYAMVQIPSLKIKANDLRYLMVRATEQQTSEKPPVAADQPKQENR